MLDDCERVIELNFKNIQGVLLRLVLVDVERFLGKFVADVSLRRRMGQGPAEEEEDFEVDIGRGLFLKAGDICGLGVIGRWGLAFELSRLEDVHVALLRLVHVRPLSGVGLPAADM